MKSFTIHLVEKDGRYLCNKAVSPTKIKTTKKWYEVDCQNCMKAIIKEENGKNQKR